MKAKTWAERKILFRYVYWHRLPEWFRQPFEYAYDHVVRATGWDALALLALPLLVCFHGYVVMRLWEWHVVPVFGAPTLQFGHSVGLSTLWSLSRTRIGPDNGKSLSEHTVICITVYSAALFAGWCAR